MHYSQLGYDSYEGKNGYLDGREWQQIHNFFYKYCGMYRCRICHEKRGLLLHKRSYEHLTLRSLRKRFFYMHPLVVRWLKSHMVWLCRKHNGMIHFYDDGSRVPLTYKALWEREQVIYKRHHSLLWKLRKMRPSDVLRAIGKLFTIYSV